MPKPLVKTTQVLEEHMVAVAYEFVMIRTYM